MLTIYGVYASRATRTLWMANEIGLEFSHVPVVQCYKLPDPMAADAPINTLSPAFLKVNPMALIPSIDDDGFILHESLAINLYLAKKYGGDLGPKDLQEDALMTQWSLFAATALETDTLKVASTVGGGQAETEQGKAVIEVALRTLKRPFAVLEGQLAGVDYIVGNRFTVADINLSEVVRYAQSQTAFFDQYPNVKAWMARCQARPAFKKMWEGRAAELAAA